MFRWESCILVCALLFCVPGAVLADDDDDDGGDAPASIVASFAVEAMEDGSVVATLELPPDAPVIEVGLSSDDPFGPLFETQSGAWMAEIPPGEAGDCFHATADVRLAGDGDDDDDHRAPALLILSAGVCVPLAAAATPGDVNAGNGVEPDGGTGSSGGTSGGGTAAGCESNAAFVLDLPGGGTRRLPTEDCQPRS